MATFYPDEHVESTSVDGYVRRSYVDTTVDESWATLISSAGTGHDDEGGVGIDHESYISIASSTTNNQWRQLYRGIILFDKSSITGQTITAGTLRLYSEWKSDASNITPDINVYGSNPASNVDLVNADYGNLLATPFCDTPITYAGWDDNGWNSFTLNAAALVALNAADIVKFGIRNANYDVGASSPAWAGGILATIGWFQAEKGAGYKPELILTVAAAAFRAQVMIF